MEKIKTILSKTWPYIILLLLVTFLAIINVDSKTFLTGGDNLHNELNDINNLKRNIFGAWQEHQGLGLLGGMSHASDIFRQIFLIIPGFFIPENLIRYFYAFLTLFIGSAGTFILSKRLLSSFWKKDLLILNLLSLLSGILYVLNLATIQSYFVPFEAFMHHFASLPWLILATILYFSKPNKKHLFFVGLISFLATPASYVSTLFLVFLASSTLIIIFYAKKDKNFIFNFIKFYLVIFFVNSFWLLPFLFFSITSTDVNLNAKINQMATSSIYLQNKEFGGITDVILLKGFWLNYVEPNLNGTFAYMFSAWREHLSNPFINIIGYLIFLVTFLGSIFSLKTRKKSLLGLTAIFIFSIVMLTTSTPPFSWLNDFLRENIPLFNQIFRFPFTKFSILASLSFSLLFPIGLIFILSLLKSHSRRAYFSSIFISIVMVILFVLPVFKGNLFYEREKIQIPSEYFKTFEYFNTQEKEKRIANLPQYTFWGWSFYDWGYSGGGFLWYGINQPILDRNFDMWSPKNENYYWEISQALYSKNSSEFLKVLNKYDIEFLIIDKNILSISPKSLFLTETEEIISEIPSIKKEKDFGNIQIYKVDLKNKPDKFIQNINYLTSVNNSKWSNFDPSYDINSSYISKNSNSNFYPFKSLFTNKSEKQTEFESTETDKHIDFISPLSPGKNVNIHIPSLASKNNTLPVKIIAENIDNSLKISLEVNSPEVFLKEKFHTKKIWESKINRELFLTDFNETKFLNINGISKFEINDIKSKKIIGTTSLYLDQNNIFFLNNSDEEIDSISIDGQEIKEYFAQDDSFISIKEIKPNTTLIVRILKTNDNYSSLNINPVDKLKNNETKIINCDNFRKEYFSYEFTDETDVKLSLKSKNASPCISFYASSLDHDQSYFVSVKNKNIKGQPIHFWVLNEDQKTPIIDTYFDKNHSETISNFILPPLERFGKAYSFHFDNISIGNENANNVLGEIKINPIPFYFLTNIRISDQNNLLDAYADIKLNTSHPNESLYIVSAENQNKPFAFSLSQSYSPYWKAYLIQNPNSKLTKIFPFLEVEIKNHYEADGWKNAWIINEGKNQNETNLVIIYLPQYLIYLGLFLSFSTLLILAITALRKDGEN